MYTACLQNANESQKCFVINRIFVAVVLDVLLNTRYLDGWHYCTKTRWFSSEPDEYPAPFNKTFHLEMGLAVGGGKGNDWEPGEFDVSALPQEMLVDYVRISQVRGLLNNTRTTYKQPHKTV